MIIFSRKFLLIFLVVDVCNSPTLCARHIGWWRMPEFQALKLGVSGFETFMADNNM